MKKKNNDGFYVAIGMFFVLSICILLGFCGEEIISEVDMFDKVIILILKGICLFFVIILLVWGCKMYISEFGVIEEYTFASDMKKGKKYTAIIFENEIPSNKTFKYLKKVIFYSTKIKSKVFSCCKSLKEVTLYDNKNIEKDAFLGCESLSLIRFYGTKEEWESHKIFIPSNPKIEFLGNSENKITINKTKIDLNYNGTINIRNR